MYIRHFATIHALHSKYGHVPPTLDYGPGELVHEWRYGSTGTGKSHSARTEYPEAYIKAADTKWWDGYRGQDVVIIEDFDKYHVKQGYSLKIWADKYPFPAESKGCGACIRPCKIIVTSNYHIKDIWTDESTVGPLMRRFKKIRFLKSGEVPDPFIDHSSDEVRLGYVPSIQTFESLLNITQ